MDAGKSVIYWIHFINLPLQNLAFQGGDVVAAKTSIVEKKLDFRQKM